MVVTSGDAAGVDLAAHAAALKAGGTTTIVLAEGIMGFRVKGELDPIWDWDRVCVVSESRRRRRGPRARVLLRARTTMRANLTEVLDIAQGTSATKPTLVEQQLSLLS